MVEWVFQHPDSVPTPKFITKVMPSYLGGGAPIRYAAGTLQPYVGGRILANYSANLQVSSPEDTFKGRSVGRSIRAVPSLRLRWALNTMNPGTN